MKSRRFALALLIAVLLLPRDSAVEACGPFFEADVFVDVTAPDDRPAFAKGDLGILQAKFDSSDYAVAYRYLNGGRLSDAERAAYAPPMQPAQVEDWSKLTPQQVQAAREAEQNARTAAQPADRWLAARAHYTVAIPDEQRKESFPVDYDGTIVFDPNYLNCPDPAFTNALLTLKQRAGAWGGSSPWLIDWINAQDAVFSNCVGKSASAPAAAPANSPALLRFDRAYQMAAAAFYAKHYDEAAAQFAAIARDKSSPWNGYGDYLAARATVRKAFAMGKATDPYSGDLASYDPDTMQRAQQMLEALLAEKNPQPSRAAIEGELNFIRIRTEPEKRMNEICAALAGPAQDASFKQDLDDLNWALIKQVKAEHPAPLLAWINAWRGPESAEDAFAAWKQNHAPAWLVMAMAKAGATDKETPGLLADAEKIKPGTPAYDTVFYHRVRLLIALKRSGEARALLDAALPALRSQASSKLNALLGERLEVARDFSEFLSVAPRAILNQPAAGSNDRNGVCQDAAGGKSAADSCSLGGHPYGFDSDAVRVLNNETPLDLLVQAAGSTSLPPNLRQYVVLAAWTRSVVLEDGAHAAELVPLLPKPIRASAGPDVGFKADLVILRDPGLRPYLEGGISRLGTFGELDNYRDNWWNGDWAAPQNDTGAPEPKPMDASSFLAKEQIAVGEAESSRVKEHPEGVSLIGQRVIDYAKAHAEDSDVPEALAMVVRATRYGASSADAKAAAVRTAVSKAAFQLLHGRYPKSTWTANTPYYY